MRIGFDGRVHKRYKGPLARERYENEYRMLKYLEEKGCDFVPKVLEAHPEELYMVTSNCGHIVQKLSKEKERSIFEKLESYGVKHDDAFTRNITYSPHLGKFCVIDFEFAVLKETGEGLTLAEAERQKGKNYERPKDD